MGSGSTPARVVVIGASGDLGTRVVTALADGGIEAIGLDQFPLDPSASIGISPTDRHAEILRPGDILVHSGSAQVVFADRWQLLRAEEAGPYEFSSRLLVWSATGRGSIVVAGRTIDLQPGVVVMLPPKRRVIMRADPDSPMMLCVVHLETAGQPEAMFGTESANGITVLTGIGGVWVARVGEVAIDVFDNGRQVTVALLHSLGVILVDAIRKMMVADYSADAPLPALLERLLIYVVSQPARDVPTIELADLANCSVSTVERLFRSRLARSPQTWIREHRLATASQLLRDGATVAEAAAGVGYHDPSYFTRLFTKSYGVPPRAWGRGSA